VSQVTREKEFQRELESGGLTGLIQDPERETALLEGIAARVIDRAMESGADGVKAAVSSSLGRSVTVRMGEVETLEDSRDRGLSVTVYRGRQTGSASSGDLRPETVDETVDRALAIARFTQADPASGLADRDLMAREFPDLDLWHPRSLSVDAMIERAREMEAAGRAADARLTNSEGGTVSFDASVGVQANSHGFMGTARGTHFGQSCVLVAGDEAGMQRDYWWDQHRRFEDLESPEATGREAARRTIDRLGSRRVPTGRVPVLFVPAMARSLLGHLVSAVSGGNLYRRSSFLLDSMGKQLLPSWVQVNEKPRLLRGARSAAFDGDGLATRDNPLVADGILERYVLGTYSARRLKMESTANSGGVRNLVFEPGNRPPRELLKEMGRGLVVTEMMGQGVNLVTGDYSRGASGFWVEDGEVVWPVEEITVAGNLREMFSGLVAAGNDIDRRANLQAPSLLVGSMMVAGQQ